MQFLKNSDPYVKFSIKNFEKLKIEYSNEQQEQQRVVLQKLYESIKEADKNVKQFLKTDISREITAIISANAFNNIFLSGSKFFPEEIKADIKDNSTYKIEYNIVFLQMTLQIIFVTHDEEINVSEYDEYIRNILVWLHILKQYNTAKCTSRISIHIFLSPVKKYLPGKTLSVLDVDNANTAVTFACHDPGEILIFRKEEWFKVLIHETFHSFGLDFSTFNADKLKKRIKGLYPINSTFDISETYTELWAEIINCVFKGFYSLKSDDLDLFITYTEFLLQIERIFSLYQCAKILKYMGLNYENLYEKNDESIVARDNLYKENTNIFAYYILKVVLMNDYIGFLTWCNNNNASFIQFTKTEHNLDMFYRYIKEVYKSPEFISDLYTISKIKGNKILSKTMRMTAIEIL